jgi:hypothetical protein
MRVMSNIRAELALCVRLPPAEGLPTFSDEGLGVIPAHEPEHPAAADLSRPRTLNNMRLFFRSVAEL